MHKIDLVVARFDEDLTWLLDVPIHFRIVVYNKGPELVDPAVISRIDVIENRHNVGREAESYFAHLQSNRSKNSDWIIFTQGDPFPHSPNFLRLLGIPESWRVIQALSVVWLEDHNIPPQHLVKSDVRDWLADIPIRREIFSLRTWDPLSFNDPGTTIMNRNYLERHRVPDGTNIAEHFLRLVEWHDLADRAALAELGIFSYGAIFAVKAELAQNMDSAVLKRLVRLSSVDPLYGYICERLWLHFFGQPFIEIAVPEVPVSNCLDS